MASSLSWLPEADYASLDSRVAIVTGSSSGIGLATVQLLLSKGMKVVGGDLNPVKSDETAIAQFEKDGLFIFVKTDISKWDDLTQLFRVAKDKFTVVDCVFANAGIIEQVDRLAEKHNDLAEPQEPDYTTIDINLKGAMNTVTLALWSMKATKTQGSIVTTSSIAGLMGFLPVHYATSKHGLLGFTRSVHLHLQYVDPAPIRINAITPSFTTSNLISYEAATAAGISIQSPEAVAKSVALLFADNTRNGQVIYSNSGQMRDIEGELLEKIEQSIPTSTGLGHQQEGMMYMGAVAKIANPS